MWKLQNLTVTAFNCWLQLWIPMCVLSASLLQHLLFYHSNSNLAFSVQLPYLGRSNLLLQNSIASQAVPEGCCSYSIRQKFSLWVGPLIAPLFHLKKLMFCILQNLSTHHDASVLAFSSFMAQAFIFLCLHPQANKTVVWGAISWKNFPVNVGWCDPCLLPDKLQNKWK